MSLDSHFINAITSEIEPQYTVDKRAISIAQQRSQMVVNGVLVRTF